MDRIRNTLRYITLSYKINFTGGVGLLIWMVLLILPSVRLCSEFSVNARFHDKTVHNLRSSEPEAEAEPPPMAARSVLDRLA